MRDPNVKVEAIYDEENEKHLLKFIVSSMAITKRPPFILSSHIQLTTANFRKAHECFKASSETVL